MTVSTTLHDQAVELLHALAGPTGIHASTAQRANYRAVFARDAVMAGLAGVLADDATVIAALVRTLEELRALQGAEGQIASNYELRDGNSPRVSFGTLAPRIDSAAWYVIGVAVAARAGALDAAGYRESVAKTLRLLDAIEYNGRHLVYVPVGGDWADEYVHDGYILYDQVLRVWALRLAAAVFGDGPWTDKAAAIERTIERTYWPADSGSAHKRVYPLAAFSPAAMHDRFDLAACALLAVANTAPQMARGALDWIVERFLRRGKLPPAFHPVIDENDPEWPALRRYHLHGFRNRPHEYHNGGIWPIWLGWLGVGFARMGREGDAARLADIVQARLSAIPRFAFEEFLHGVTNAPGGTPWMAYTAAGVVLLEAARTPERLAVLAT